MRLERIEGFRTPGEFAQFQKFLEGGISSGDLREIPADPTYHVGEIYGGRWFEFVADGSVWRLISPDPPFLGLFERVRKMTLVGSK